MTAEDPVKWGGKAQVTLDMLAQPVRVNKYIAEYVSHGNSIMDAVFSNEPRPPLVADPNPDPDDVCTCGHADHDHEHDYYEGYLECEFCECDDYTNKVWHDDRRAKAEVRLRLVLSDEDQDDPMFVSAILDAVLGEES